MQSRYRQIVFISVIGFFTAVCILGPAWSASQKVGSASGTDSQTALQEKTRLFDFSRTDFKSRFTGTIGYRSDDLDWNIAGDITGQNPNILSELKWEDLSIFQIKGANTTVFRGIYFRGALAYGWIYAGDVQDSDFLRDDRGVEFSRSNNSADDGSTLDASAAIGYQFLFQSGFIGISPIVGYSYHEQNLTMTDGFQTLESPITPPLGPVNGLNSSYDTEWKGPWVGVDLSFRSPGHDHPEAVEGYELTFGFEYHWADYEAVADWNLRTDFAHPKSFEHIADGQGILLFGEFNYFFTSHWAIQFSANYQTWETDPGVDRTFFANGTVSEIRLNEVNWTSYALMLGMVYAFQ